MFGVGSSQVGRDVRKLVRTVSLRVLTLRCSGATDPPDARPDPCDISTAARLGEGTAESAKDVLQDLGRGRKVEPDMALAGFAKVQPLAEGDLRVL